MKEQNKILTLKSKLLLLLVAGFVALFAFGIRTYAAGSYSYYWDYFYDQNDSSFNDISYTANLELDFQIACLINGSMYQFYSLDGSNLRIYDFESNYKYYSPSGDVVSEGIQKTSFSVSSTTAMINLDTNIPIFSTSEQVLNYLQYGDDSGQLNKPQIEVPEFDSLESDSDFCLKGFSADNSILATWNGTVTDEYENEESFVVAYLGYAYKEQPAQIAVRELYNSKVLITDNQFSIPWDDVQHEDESLFLRYVEFIPFGRINPDKLFYPYIKGCSAYIYFSLDASGNIDSVKIPITVDKDSLTTNIVGGTFDSSIPALSDVVRVDNGFADVMSSYSQSSTIKWSTVFSDSNYYVQVRTTFRYKLNADKVWSEVTVDTSVPTGRFSCLVDAQSFTYTYGDYGSLFWKQDDSIWTDDDLDRQGNLQPIRDSIRIVHIDNGVVSYGPWTTFTLKNGIWQTGEVTGSYESDYLEEDNTGGSIVEGGEVNSNFLTDFDFTDISGVWDAFIGIFKNLFSFLGQFPDLFSQIFSFLPYEIRSMIYVSMVAICVLGLVKAVVK